MGSLTNGRVKNATKQAFLSQKLMLTVSELSEAMEALRTDHFADITAYSDGLVDIKVEDEESEKLLFEKTIKNSFEDELADSLIRILDLAGKMNIDIDWFVNRKMQYNGARPHMHGKNF
jgi:NTP pyrophosphatase (non-canonical NTP hydrolase)